MSIEAKSEKFWQFIDKNAEIKQVVTGFGFTEGPVFSRRGFLLFSDIPNNKILKWERGKLTTLRENSNKANGLTFDHQGRLIAAEGGGRVTRTEKNGTLTVLAEEDCKVPMTLCMRSMAASTSLIYRSRVCIRSPGSVVELAGRLLEERYAS